MLKLRLKEMAKDPANKIFWHRDKTHHYTFGESALQNGAIYSLKERRADGDYKKLTARYLVPVKMSADFEKHLENVAEVFYKR